MAEAIPTHPMALPRLVLLTEALLRDLTQEPSLTVSVHLPPHTEI